MVSYPPLGNLLALMDRKGAETFEWTKSMDIR